MSDGRTENQSSVKFLLISIILHALFVLLVPKLGYGPPAIPLSRGGTTFVTLVPSNGRDSARQAAQVTQPKRESPPPPRKSQQVVTLKSPPVPAPTKPPTTPPKKQELPVEKIPGAKVLTSDAGRDQAPSTVSEKPPARPVVTEDPTPSDVSAPVLPAKEPEQPADSPAPPLAGDMIQGLGILDIRVFPDKETAMLTEPVRLRFEVTVSGDAKTVIARALGSSGDKRADSWATSMVTRGLEYKAATEPYQVTIELLIDRDTKKVALSAPDERVRFVKR